MGAQPATSRLAFSLDSKPYKIFSYRKKISETYNYLKINYYSLKEMNSSVGNKDHIQI